MEISRDNQNALRLQFRATSLTIGAEPSAAPVRLVTQVSKQVDPGKEEKVFQGAGEYEIAGIMVDGVVTSSGLISYHVLHDGYQVTCLVLHKIEDITDAIIEQLQPSQVLCIWSADENTAGLAALVARFEANLIVPIDVVGGVEALAKELQLQSEPLDKIKLNQKDLQLETSRLIAL